MGHSHLQGTEITVAGVHRVVYEATTATVGKRAREREGRVGEGEGSAGEGDGRVAGERGGGKGG